ncbi:MAG TPA: ABC transporter substrate-binding protein, partial [Polyangiaceae bacterium]|nr:ABC transporter substrate-binding protein [Polyangiaceae bacterium]
YLLTRSDRPPFDRPEARHALSEAIDRESIVKYLLAGKAQPAKWLVPDGHWAAPKNLKPLVFAPALARTVLSRMPAVTLLTSTDRSRVVQARAVAQMLTESGLRTQVVPLELGLLLARLDAGQFTLAILQIPELTEPNVLSWFFHPRGIATDSELPVLGKNRAHYRSPEAARLLDTASASFDPEERRALYVQFAARMLEDMPVIPLWHEDHITLTRGRGARFAPSAEGRWSSLAEL